MQDTQGKNLIGFNQLQNIDTEQLAELFQKFLKLRQIILIEPEKAFVEFENFNKRKLLKKPSIIYYRTSFNYFNDFLKTQHIKVLAEIDITVIEKYIDFKLSQNLSAASINTYLRAVKTFLNFSYEKNYCHKLKIQLLPEEREIKPSLTEDEIEQICGADKTPTQLMAMLLLSTGIRSNTLNNLKVGDFNFNDKTLVLKVTKNKKQYILPVFDKIIDRVKSHTKNKKPTDFVFVNTLGNQYNKRTLWATISNFLEDLGIEKSGVHLFRHTFATISAQKGASAFIIQKWLNHSSITQSQGYVALQCKELADSNSKYNPIADFI